jgi:transcriptional regulator with XRE-family HTH domain
VKPINCVKEREKMLDKLVSIRKRKGMTQEALSRASGIHRVTIAKYETGTSSPRLTNLEKLAAVLGVTVSELLGEEKAG